MNNLEPLRRNKDFRYVYRRGKKINGSLMALVYLPQNEGIKAGFSISKKIGNSVVRNKAKRRMKESFRLMLPSVNPALIVFIARPGAAQADYHQIRKCMIYLLSSAGLLKNKVI